MVQDTFNETVEETSAAHPNMETDEVVEKAYEELKPQHTTHMISNYIYPKLCLISVRTW